VGQPTMEDVAKRAGVSRALVSLVMRDSPRVSEHSRVAVLEAADALGYRPNLMARNLASRRTMTIGLVLNDLHNPFFAEITDSIHQAATEAGYRIVINTGLRSLEGEQAAVETFLEFRTDGIIAVGPWMSSSQLHDLSRETTLVVVARAVESDVFDTVNVDERRGGHLIVDHLVELGHRRIAYIDGGEGAGSIERRSGYLEGMAAHGLDDYVTVVGGTYNETVGTLGVQQLIDSGTVPTAIFAGNDFMALSALDRLEDEGLQVPEDVSLVGFDNTALAALHHIGLTTVDQPPETLGALAMQCLVERLEGDRSEAVHHVLAPSLVVRTTSGPVAKENR
jgi:DNA-binding LacI/PurR family transcriptional regulator